MTIQRQYSLPNCTLLLEGLNDATTGSGQLEVRPVMSILVNAECHLAGSAPPLTGGREFFDSLVTAVSRYAQEFLSGVHHPYNTQEPPLVQLRRINRNLHRLIVQRRADVHLASNGMMGKTGSTAPVEIDITTVQLFDLVEAVDQFFADSQTLPGLSLLLTPVERRYAHADQPVLKRAAPAAIGVSSLAVAALALFFVPIPEVQRPKEPLPQANSNSLSTTSGAEGQVTTGSGPIGPTPLASETPSASPVAQTATPSPLASETATPSPLASETATPSPLASETATPSPSELSTAPTTATVGSEITDNNTLRDLNGKLQQQILQNKEEKLKFPRQLLYRVAMRPDGTIADYEARNQPARDYENQTPLPKLKSTSTPTSSATGSEEPLAYFKVVFTLRGVPQVSPWRGYR
ncbi:DUF4335 domain-containing protein [Argonema galeatum]|uniref:DUF4335 domain-containing protein n=1 Tax=Argonema galeatum TaxID=2942762 RepID=UPI002011E549|nr:DUF4335 domain-containing protein [Argonema galeatum]MCL1467920.1 DUF4335 domain-containing protein [Argonema galeatum A003/A1]